MNRVFRWAATWFAALLVACASPPVRYYTLQLAQAPTFSTAGPASYREAGPDGVPFELLPIGLPAQLDRPELIVREGTAGVQALSTQRWVSPLDEELRDALSARLALQLHASDMAGLPRAAGLQVQRIKVQVRQFDAWPGRGVHLEATWSIAPVSTGSSGLICSGQFDERVPTRANGDTSSDYANIVQALQNAVASLASRIAVDVQASANSRASRCAGPT